MTKSYFMLRLSIYLHGCYSSLRQVVASVSLVRSKVLEKGDHETTIENKEVKLRVNCSSSSTQAEPLQTVT